MTEGSGSLYQYIHISPKEEFLNHTPRLRKEYTLGKNVFLFNA
uniref:Uncharacterized protein n=1 Tax=Anguilla anguilla TaxID=7936 RepID=A0A0E9Q2H6_ANGAN